MFSFVNRRSFTLIELLLVIGIVAILSVVTVIVLNPAELLKQSRDTRRLTELASLNRSLNIVQAQVTGAFFGTSTVVYVSLADTTSTCANLGLPALPSGYSYRCATAANLRNVDGTGWIPVNFTLAAGSPISSLPIDPINSAATGQYYTYVPGGSWELTAIMESAKHMAKQADDGGADPFTFEYGTNLTLNPLATAIAAYWKMDETSGTRKDSVGSSDLSDTNTVGSAAGKYGNAAEIVLANSEYLSKTDNAALSMPTGQSFTLAMWLYPNTISHINVPLMKGVGGGVSVLEYRIVAISSTEIRWNFVISNGSTAQSVEIPQVVQAGQWQFLVAWYDAVAGTLNFQKDNGTVYSVSIGTSYGWDSTNPLYLSGCVEASNRCYDGRVDSVGVWKRVLSAGERSRLYNGGAGVAF